MTQDKSKGKTLREFFKPKHRQSDTIDLAETHYPETEPIACKWCGSTDIQKYGSRKGVQEYICNGCGRKFIAKDAPYKKQTSIALIGTSISQYYDGLSFPEVARQLAEKGSPVNESTVYRWIMSYTEKAIGLLTPLKPKVSDTWIADETAIKFSDKLFWVWDIIDQKTRFLLATYLSSNRGTKQARILMESASKQAGKVPKVVITDKLSAYLDGIEIPFGADPEHIRSSPFAGEKSTSLIERFHGTIKDRTKVIRGFKTFETASLIIEGFRIHYNFFRPHISLQNRTPAEVAGIKFPFKTWTDFVRQDK